MLVQIELIIKNKITHLVVSEHFSVTTDSMSTFHLRKHVEHALHEMGVSIPVVYADQLGGTDVFNKGVILKIKEELNRIPKGAKVAVFLSNHGFPTTKIGKYNAINDCYHQINPYRTEDFIFTSQKGTVFSIQRINVIFKTLKIRYDLTVQNFSTHSMRKTFGREIFNKSGVNAELALVKLSQLFNHSNPAITRRYLGIAKEEMMKTYDLLGF